MTDTPPKPKRRRWRWLALSAVFVVALGSWLLHSPPPPAQLICSDGTQIAFLAADLGKIDYCADSKLYRWGFPFLQRYAPAALVKRLPRPRVHSMNGVASRTGAQPLMLLFDVRKDAKQATATRRLHDFIKLEFVETSGHRFSGFPVGLSLSANGLQGQSYDSFPRRQPRLVIELTELAAPGRSARIEIANPGHRPEAPQWTPHELPQTRSDPAVDVTLNRPDGDSEWKSEKLPIHIVVRAPAWKKHSIVSWIEDATGNFGNGLSPFEAAWKARVILARTDPESFDASEKWTLGPIAVSPAGSRQSIEQSGKIGEIIFNVRALETKGLRTTPAGRPLPSPGPPAGTTSPVSDAAGQPVERILRVDVSDVPRNSTLISLVDDQAGRRLSEFSQTFLSGGSNLRRGVGVRFTPKSDTTHVTLTLIVSKPSEFEFLFAPQAAREALPMPLQSE